MTNLILKTCPKCGCCLKEDDIDDKYRDGQIEWSHCIGCGKDYRVTIYHGKVYRLIELN